MEILLNDCWTSAAFGHFVYYDTSSKVFVEWSLRRNVTSSSATFSNTSLGRNISRGNHKNKTRKKGDSILFLKTHNEIISNKTIKMEISSQSKWKYYFKFSNRKLVLTLF